MSKLKFKRIRHTLDGDNTYDAAYLCEVLSILISKSEHPVEISFDAGHNNVDIVLKEVIS